MRLLAAAGLLLLGQILSQLLLSSEEQSDPNQMAAEGESQMNPAASMKSAAGVPEMHLLEYKICTFAA